MKIAIDIREAGKEKTGKGWYTFNLVTELLKLDKDNEYLLYTDSQDLYQTKNKNALVIRIDEKSWKWHFAVLKDIKKRTPDIFFAPTSYIIPAFSPKWLKTVITVHDLVSFMFPSTHSFKATVIERFTLKSAMRKASSVLVVSENTKKDLLKRFKYKEENIHITPCAASDIFKNTPKKKEIEELREKLGLPENFILGVGTLEPRKNFETLIKSFVVIKRKHPDFKLVLVGKKGWKFKKIGQTITNYGLKDDVIFTGYLDDSDLHKIYSSAKVFVFPSLYEGFGIPPLEAMASGCPVVSSNLASLPEVIGEAGILVDPRNSLKIAEAVSGLITNESAREMFITRGKEQAERFSWEKSAQVVLDTFQQISAIRKSKDESE